MGFSLVAGSVCVIFFLIGLVCVNLLSPDPDCAQILNPHSFCMGFSLMAGSVYVIFFLIGLVRVNLLSPEPDCAQIFSLHSFCMGFSLVASSVCIDFTILGLDCVNFFLVGSVCVFCPGPKCDIISINKDFTILPKVTSLYSNIVNIKNYSSYRTYVNMSV